MNGQPELIDGQCANGCTPEENNAPYRIGGLTWSLPVGHRIEDYLLFYVGSDDSAFANISMTYNTCEIGVSFSFLCVKLSLFALIYLAVNAVFQMHCLCFSLLRIVSLSVLRLQKSSIKYYLLLYLFLPPNQNKVTSPFSFLCWFNKMCFFQFSLLIFYIQMVVLVYNSSLKMKRLLTF